MIKAVVLDLYGTLLYLSSETKPYLKLFTDLGLTVEEFRQARQIALTEDTDLKKLAARIKPEAQLDLTLYEQEIKQEIASARLFPETKAVLDELKDRKLKIGLISNLASPYKQPFFDLGLNTYFDRVIFSCETGLIKDNLRIYELMLQDLNLDPASVLMTGDKERNDVIGPKAVGMEAILLDRNCNNNCKNSINNLEGVFQYL